MPTTASKTVSPPSRRAAASSPTLTRGPTARSAASPRLPPQNPSNDRRSASRQGQPSRNSDAHDALTASLKQETDEKERLLVQLQDNEQLLNNYITENGNLTSALSAAETRLNEFYLEQSRWEMEMAQRQDITEKLREQVRELEREKRDLQRRYNEQTATFEAERQAFYDNEQHLKSRIQTLSQVARKRNESLTRSTEQEPEPDRVEEERPSTPRDDGPERTHQDFNDPESEPAEMTSLKLELSTLSTSYASLQSTLVLIQTQLVDLKRVNQELQEENESYMILLREKTLSGQFHVGKQVGGTSSVASEDDASDEDMPDKSTDMDSMRSHTKSTLDIVEEEEPFDGMDTEALGDNSDDDRSHRNSRRPERRRTLSHGHRGESLAGLPITGPGLDLAAELGRAENKDILAETSIDDGDRNVVATKAKRTKKEGHKIPLSDSSRPEDIEALRTEVKSLKDANKALSLYASKIIDRIIAQEGFEHVLAIDYEKEPSTPSTALPLANPSKSMPFSPPASKPRPQSTINAKAFETKSTSMSTKAQRRSLSFDWKAFSLFNTDKKPEPSPNLRPLTLTPGAASVTSARKLDNVEDEEDRRERERLHATMKLMGYPTQSPSVGAPMERASTEPNSVAKKNRRFSLFNSKTPVNESDTSSLQSTTSSARYDANTVPQGLTQEALEFAEAEHSLAVLDARERDLTVEIAKGGSGGFTEITPRSGRRARRSGGSSGSTVWSAGMSGTADE